MGKVKTGFQHFLGKHSRSVILFKAIDIICHPGQNLKKFPGITVEKDIIYDGEETGFCAGDIYYDKTFEKDGKYPVIMNIHGGGFVAGDKKHRESLSSLYASKGFFVWNINYHLAPDVVYPASLIDSVNALNYLNTLAERYNLDLDKVIVTGDSAGAYYATHLVACSLNEDLRKTFNVPDFKVKIAALMSFCGVYDMLLALGNKLPFELTWDMGRLLLGIELKKDMSDLSKYPHINELSPKNYISEKWCPTFLAISAKDVFCKGQGEALEKSLREHNVPVYSFSSKKLVDNHCFHLELYKKISQDCFNVVFDFLDMVRKGVFK